MLLVDERARDSDLNKAVRRLRMQGQHEVLVSLPLHPELIKNADRAQCFIW